MFIVCTSTKRPTIIYQTSGKENNNGREWKSAVEEQLELEEEYCSGIDYGVGRVWWGGNDSNDYIGIMMIANEKGNAGEEVKESNAICKMCLKEEVGEATIRRN